MIKYVQNIEEAVLRAITESTASRNSKLDNLDQEFSTQMQSLREKMVKIREPFLKYADLGLKSDQLIEEESAIWDFDSEDEDALALQQQAEKKMEALNIETKIIDGQQKELENQIGDDIKNIIKDHPKLNISQDFFSDRWKLDRRPKYKHFTFIKFAEEQLLNRCFNRFCFVKDVHAILEANKATIFRAFNSGDYSHLDLNQITFQLQLHTEETHNRGKVPVKITCNLEENKSLDLYFKPRDARIDALIIELFKNLNALEEKSLEVNLPTYTITNMNQSGQPFSIWEFIDGTHLAGDAASDAISQLPDAYKRDYLQKQLLRLESVLSYLNISDLHLDNLIFKNLNTNTPQIVPIDLESVQPGKATGLFSREVQTPNLTAAERDLLDQCIRIIGQVSFRFVPIPTSHFLGGLTSCEAFKPLASNVKKSLGQKGYQLSISLDLLEWYILQDLIHNDVTYLTINNDQVYYRLANDDIVIARRNN